MKKIRAYSESGFSLPNDAVVVSLSPFPKDGEWGGAIRSREISRAIKNVFPKSYVVNCNTLHYAWLPMPDFVKQGHPQLDDIRMLFKDFGIEGFLDGVPDAIIFDHPWLWTEVKKLKERYPEVKVIHSSHNIEFMLKPDLLEGLEPKYKNATIDFLEDIEVEIAENSDLVICVTERDADWFRRNGAKHVVAVNNGTNAYLSEVKSDHHYALVVGSGHPPNIEGSIKYLKNAVDWLPDHTDLIFVGSMCDGLRGQLGPERNDYHDTTIRFLGVRTDSELNALIESANVIVLPIPYGGGSNLKTAEALVSGRPVVGTSTSFRGFEEYAMGDFVRVTDAENQFRAFVAEACERKYPTVSREGSEHLTWAGTTSILKEYLRSISGTSA
jgi:glycosyltransferase involved in cell wall biosynthesis